MKPKDKGPVIKESPITYDEYAQLTDEGNRYELAQGVLELMTPAPSPKHQMISGHILNKLMESCNKDYLIFSSPIDLILSNIEVRQPDLIMIHRSKVEIITKRGIEGIPDLVIEILSPHSIKRDKFNKLDVYEKYQITEYWIVDPANEALEQYVLKNGSYELLNIFERDDSIQSEHIKCASFTMAQIVETAKELP